MPEAWRIVKKKHAATAFSGEGASRGGGRWNSRGVPVVYTSSTRSLAALETLVHLNPPMVFEYVVIRVVFSDALVKVFPQNSLPLHWKAEPPPTSTKKVGDDWVAQGQSAVLALPSVIVPEELNYLLNPAHADFKQIVLGAPEDFSFDPRLLS